MAKFPTFLSYSAMKLYGFDGEGCPYAYYLRYVKKLKPSKYNCRNFYVGWICHACQEQWVNNGMKPGTIKSYIDSYKKEYLKKNTVIFKGQEDYDTLEKRMLDYADCIESAFHKLEWTKKRWKTEIAMKEWDESLECFFYARLDLLDVDRLVAADLKCTKSTQYFDRNQGVFSTILMSKHYKKPVNEFIQFVPMRKELTVPYYIDAEERKLLYNKIRTITLSMKAGKFEANPDKSRCYRCELSEFCSHKYSDSTKLDYVQKDGKRKVSL